MEAHYFDAHCHVQFDAYDADREDVLARMKEANVGGLVVGCDLASSRKAVELVRQHPDAGLYAAIGLHPNAVLTQEFDEQAFDELAALPEVVAIGECGLDYYRPEDVSGAKAKQKEVFNRHIELAVKYEKPLIVHARPSKGAQDAYHDALEIFEAKKKEAAERLRGDMHFFVGGVEEARRFVALDFTLSYTAVITFARDYDDVIRSIPLSHLLSETDSPYVAPAPNRGQRNEPLAVRHVVQSLAQIRGEQVEEVAAAILQNSRKLFRISL